VRHRRLALLIGAGLFLLLLLALSLRFVLQPARVAGFVLDSLGKSLGLQITATGDSEYRLRGTPMLVVRNVVAREPGATTPLLRAQRVYVSVPWSTVRSRGEQLDMTRIEVDAPVLDITALQHWLASRPASKTPIPTLSNGLRLTEGRLVGDNWRVDGLAISLQRLHPDQRVDAHVTGRYLADPFSLQFDVAAAMTKPANDAGIAIVGPIIATSGEWRLPARLKLSAPLHFGDGGIRSERLRASASARYESGKTQLPFALAITSPLRFGAGTLSLAPAGIALRGEGVVPTLDASGALAHGKRLLVRLDGRLADWPDGWPTLPPPIGASDSPFPFALRYLGRDDFSDVAALRLQRDDTRFDARLHVADAMAWATAGAGGSPLPPLSGHLATPGLEISGAQLDGVEIEFDEATVPAATEVP
jgi:hypothetical protein